PRPPRPNAPSSRLAAVGDAWVSIISPRSFMGSNMRFLPDFGAGDRRSLQSSSGSLFLPKEAPQASVLLAHQVHATDAKCMHLEGAFASRANWHLKAMGSDLEGIAAELWHIAFAQAPTGRGSGPMHPTRETHCLRR